MKIFINNFHLLLELFPWVYFQRWIKSNLSSLIPVLVHTELTGNPYSFRYYYYFLICEGNLKERMLWFIVLNV